MTASPQLHPLSAGSTPDAVATVFVHRSPVGAHVGVCFCDDERNARLLHQAWHHDTRCDDAGSYAAELQQSAKMAVWWLQPALDHDELQDLGQHARLVAKQLGQGGIPYALHPRDARITRQGVIDLRGSLGLTCATLVTRLFDAAQIPLIDEATWDQRTPERIAEDLAAQKKLVKYLQREDPEHAARVADDEGCARVRAEEVAVASTMAARPISLNTADPAGRGLLALL